MNRRIFVNRFFGLVILIFFCLAFISHVGISLTSAQEQNQELLQIDISDFPNKNVLWQVVGDVVWNLQGEELAISLDDRILIWNTSALEFEAELTDPDGGIGFSHLAWSPDGTLLASTLSGWEFAYIWDMSLEQPELIERRGLSSCGLSSISWHPDNLVLAITNRCGDFYIWEVSNTQNEPQLIETSVSRAQWSSSGDEIALLFHDQRIIEVRDTETFGTISEHSIEENSSIDPIAIMDLNDETIILAGISPSDGNPSEGQFQFVPYIWNTITNVVSSDFQPNSVQRIADLAWDVRGDYLAVGGFANETVVIWDIESSSMVSTIDLGAEIWAMKWHPTEPQLAIARRDGKIAIWEIADLAPR